MTIDDRNDFQKTWLASYIFAYNVAMNPDSVEFNNLIRSFLQTSRTASLATVSADGRPSVCNVQYTQDDEFNLYYVSSQHSEHSVNITNDANVSVAVYAHDDRAQNIHGLQIKGEAHALSEAADCNAAWEFYTSKFAFAAALPQFAKIIQQETFYKITPHWLRWIDNRKEFGWKVEKTLQPAKSV